MNIAHRIKEVAKRIPDKKSVVLAKDNSFYTFAEFEERSNQLANRFVNSADSFKTFNSLRNVSSSFVF
jgi:acyl-CoA synthetase (AMP-forming)/AMP-acid ligase II